MQLFNQNQQVYTGFLKCTFYITDVTNALETIVTKEKNTFGKCRRDAGLNDFNSPSS